jgi:hypothetical protein
MLRKWSYTYFKSLKKYTVLESYNKAEPIPFGTPLNATLIGTCELGTTLVVIRSNCHTWVAYNMNIEFCRENRMIFYR